jgi:4-methyl-5(b-hydroxyethyl)-thiazole monophosphate biosynthesis
MLVLPGGMPGTKNLQEHAGLDALLKKFHSEGKNLSAICAAPSVLGSKGLLKDKSAICYPGYEKELIGAKVVNESVVIDGNIITSKGMGTAIDFSLAIIECLAGEAEAVKIAKAIQFEHYK